MSTAKLTITGKYVKGMIFEAVSNFKAKVIKV